MSQMQMIITGNSVKDLANVMRETAEKLYSLNQPTEDAEESDDEDTDVIRPGKASSKATKKAAPAQDLEEDEDEGAEEEDEDEEEDSDDESSDEGDDDDEDEEAEEEDGEEDDEDDEPKEVEIKSTKKAKKITIDDVNDVCKAKVVSLGGKKLAREKVLTILRKKFKVSSVSELDPKDYAAVIKAMAV